jgi:PTS system glucose-specific IIC component
MMKQSGGAIFAALPLIFAIAVAIGYTEGDGVAALAATIGFAVFAAALGVLGEAWGVKTTSVMGITSVETGVFGGLLMGCVAAYLFNRYYRISLPQYLGFFAGKRFVPIVTALAAIVAAAVMVVLWPPLGRLISTGAAAAATGDNVPVTAFVYGLVERALIPFGLHHIWNVPFFFEIGSYTDAGGQLVRGDISRFFAGDPTAGILGGAYFFKMFGLPAAALAMWRSARPDRRAQVGGIMISAALTSFLTGITEPIEFAFLFVSPLLYALHALLAGAGDFLFVSLGGRMGASFSHGLIDLLLFNHLGSRVWLVPSVGLLFGGLYYGLFRYAIVRFDLKTPGREDEVTAGAPGTAAQPGGEAAALVAALGGAGNIESLDSCITRLRVGVHDTARVQAEQLKALGATAVLQVGRGVQAIFGPRSEALKTDIQRYLATGAAAGPTAAGAAPRPAAAPQREPAPVTDAEAARARALLIALGGSANVRAVAGVAVTRVRVDLVEPGLVDEEALLLAGAGGIMAIDSNRRHLVFSRDAGAIARALHALLPLT